MGERDTMKTGEHLHAMVKQILRIDFWAGCGCKELAEEMDSHEPAWTLQPANFKRIVNKMRTTAKRAPKWKLRILARLPGARFPIRAMVREAVRRAEADLIKDD
jgi:hypothetical protein